MKKNYLKMMAAVFAVALSVGFVSCGGDDGGDEPDPVGPDPVTPVTPEKGEAMSPADQKEYLEKVALEFMDMVPASDFQTLVDFADFVESTYFKGYDWSNVENWAKDAFEATREALGTKTTESEYYANYVYTNYKALILASNFTGHFTATNGRWVRESANDLQFIFKGPRGQECVAKLETSGSVKKVKLFWDDDYQDYEYMNNMSTYFYDRTEITVGIPEKIVVTLTQAGSTMIKTTVNIDLSGINNEELNIRNANLTASALVELGNGYKVNVSQIIYKGNSSASVAFELSKNGTSLVVVGVSGKVSNLPSYNVSAFSDEFEDDDFEDSNVKDAFVKVDILGKVQVQGTLSDLQKMVGYLNDAEDNKYTESTYKSYINQANSLMDINLFYDGKSVKQAAIKLESFEDEKWDGRRYWETEPIIEFFDGSSYSSFSAFFNERDFKATIDTFKRLRERYENMVDGLF